MSRIQKQLSAHMERLKACKKCPMMIGPVVTCEPVVSRVFFVGQAPGVKEGSFGRPFAWTAGKQLFKWFARNGHGETDIRERIYFEAVCRCFPGKNQKGGDRVPDTVEIENCSTWMEDEFKLLKPELVVAIGKLAIGRFLEVDKLTDVIGKVIRVEKFGQTFDLIALPHPSGASTWHRMEPGKTLLSHALKLIFKHPAFRKAFK